jgi:DNA-binding Lrp family transcriptional regulator
MIPSASDVALIDRWQRGFPLIERPFEEVGRGVDLGEAATIATLQRLRDGGVLSRIGAVVRPHTVGASTLAAMRVPPERLDEVAALVSAEPLVNHNYAREHAINLWFVIAAPEPAMVADTLERIEHDAGIAVLDLPLVHSYHIDLGFSLGTHRRASVEEARSETDYRLDPDDRGLLAAIEDGLPLIERPYLDVARRLGRREDEVIDRLTRLSAAGVVKRFGCVVRHWRLGYTANAMAVWDVPDDAVDAVAGIFVQQSRVSLCYRRPRRLPGWRFNLFCMVHAKMRSDAIAVIDDIDRAAETGHYHRDILFSTHCFKQRGARFSQQAGGWH